MSNLPLVKTKTKTSATIRTSTESQKNEKPPKGATILESNIRTETEQIENGWLVTKSYDGRYTTSKDDSEYGHYFSYSKKWFSEDDPITVTVNDKSLADAFDDSTS